MARMYVGYSTIRNIREVFTANNEPTQVTHGDRYMAVVGPFKTIRAANFMVVHGVNNPHLQTVADAERISKEASPCK